MYTYTFTHIHMYSDEFICVNMSVKLVVPKLFLYHRINVFLFVCIVERARFPILGLGTSLFCSGEGFQDYAQALINLGAAYGVQKYKDVSVSRKTVTYSVMIKEYERIHKKLSTALIEQHLAFTTDMWTDSYMQRSFVSLSAHYICAEFKLNVKIFGVKEFEAEKKPELIFYSM